MKRIHGECEMKRIELADEHAEDQLKKDRETLKGQLELQIKQLEVEMQKRKNAGTDTEAIEKQIDNIRNRIDALNG
jgi:hypothetical protein